MLGHNEYEFADAINASETKESLLAYYQKHAPAPLIEAVEGLLGANIDTITGKIQIGTAVLEQYPHLADGYLVEELKHFQQLDKRNWFVRALTRAEEKLLEGEIGEFMKQAGFKVFKPR